MRFAAECRDGKIFYYGIGQYRELLAKLNGQRISVEIEPWQTRRTDNQAGYYRGVILKRLEREGPGYEAEEWHEILRALFLMVEKDGRRFPRSTSTLSVQEMSEYIDKVLRWAAQELGIVIEEPH